MNGFGPAEFDRAVYRALGRTERWEGLAAGIQAYLHDGSTELLRPAAPFDGAVARTYESANRVVKCADGARPDAGSGHEGGLLAEPGGAAAVGIGGPGARDVQLPVHHGVPALAGVDQADSYLGILDPAGGAGVLALDADRASALLHVAGLVDHQHRPLVVQVLHRVAPHIVTDGVGVPLGPAEQVVHAVRGGLPGPLGDGPAVVARQVRQESEYQPPGPTP